MSGIWSVVVAILLMIHGLIHLMGTVVYMKFGTIQGLAYKTEFCAGRCQFGEKGTQVYGAFWGIAALLFILSSLALWLGLTWWRPLLISTTLFSLCITLIDFKTAWAGAAINGVIIILFWIMPGLIQ